MSGSPSVIALIPARAGSKRLRGKNTRLLSGHPLIAYAISSARSSGIFAAVIVSTESAETAAIAAHYGAEVPFLRPAAFASDLSPDIEWITYTLARLRDEGSLTDCFSILRPTSPFRQPETIRRAWGQFVAQDRIDSLRAVEPCKQHPGKMWVVDGTLMTPLLDGGKDGPPWHSRAYQDLPPVYVQNASLEIAWTSVPLEGGTIAGRVVAPFLTEGHEGFDLNEPRDWSYAEHLIERAEAQLPRVSVPAYPLQSTQTTAS